MLLLFMCIFKVASEVVREGIPFLIAGLIKATRDFLRETLETTISTIVRLSVTHFLSKLLDDGMFRRKMEHHWVEIP